MHRNLARLRKWFAIAAVALVVIVAVVYSYRRVVVRKVIEREARQKLGVEILQRTEGFTLSKSEGGRTLFTVSAKKAVQYQQGGRAELQDVNILVYGRKADRYDQIYGEKFVYDPQSGDITAQGEVHIDLEGHSEGSPGPDKAPPRELANPIHLKTSGVVFNQRTGFAATSEVIEFRIPQASGSARGATYDSRNNVVELQSQVRLRTTGPQGAVITAEHGTVTADPRRAELNAVRVERGGETFEAERVQVFLSPRNDIERVLATGSVRATAATAAIRAPQGELVYAGRQPRTAVVSGGVAFEDSGAHPVRGSADRLVVDFRGQAELAAVRAVGNVRVVQQPGSGRRDMGDSVELAADTLQFAVRDGRLQRGETVGAAQVTLRPAPGAPPDDPTTVITAGRFEVGFAGANRLKSFHGAPDARIVSSVPGQPDRISLSRELDVAFNPAGRIAAIVQQGDVRFTEGQRTATAARARYTPEDGMILLTGGPRVTEGGLLLTANSLRLNRKTGDALAEGDVKTTYNDVRPQPGGALLASGDPIHVTAAAVSAQRATGTARYTGGARLWQGANIVQAPTIVFDREKRDVLAQGAGGRDVTTVFVQADRSGRVTPVNVTGARLSYSDAQRRARFEGGVVMKGADATLTADHVDVLLIARGEKAPNGAAGPSQVDRVVAEGDIQIQQASRRAQGARLVYTPPDGKFVLTGGPPSIFDAEHGFIRGDSLTFFSRDDRVIVGSSDSSRTVTQTRVNR